MVYKRWILLLVAFITSAGIGATTDFGQSVARATFTFIGGGEDPKGGGNGSP